jgi:site-specific recombinase XerD
MPLRAYKRRHSKQCLENIARRIEAGEIQPLTKKDLENYRYCRCVWWLAEGTNDYGKRFARQSLKVYTWDAACAELKKRNQPASVSVSAKDRNLTAVELRDRWLLFCAQRLGENTENTLRNYSLAIQKLIDYCERRNLRHIEEIQPTDIDQMRKDWVEIDELSTATHNTYLGQIKSFFRFAIEREYLIKNPMIGQKGRRKKRGAAGEDADDEDHMTLPLDEEGSRNYDLIMASVVPFLRNELKRPGKQTRIRQRKVRILQLPENFYCLLLLMYEIGLRVSDAVHFDLRKLRTDSISGFYTTKQIKTGDKVTCFPSLELVKRLRSLPQIKTHFPFFDGRRNWRDYINTNIRKTLAELGNVLDIPEVRPHRFRDSFAVNHLNSGTDIRDVQKLLGHRSLTTTEKYYAPYVKSSELSLRERTVNKKPTIKGTVVAFPNQKTG